MRWAGGAAGVPGGVRVHGQVAMAVDLLTRVTAADRPAMTGQSGSGAEVETVTGTVTTLLLGLS